MRYWILNQDLSFLIKTYMDKENQDYFLKDQKKINYV